MDLARSPNCNGPHMASFIFIQFHQTCPQYFFTITKLPSVQFIHLSFINNTHPVCLKSLKQVGGMTKGDTFHSKKEQLNT